MDAGVDVGDGKVGAGTNMGVDVDLDAEAEAGGGAGAIARNLRLFSSSGWTSGRGVVRRAGAEPIPMTEWVRFSTRVFDALPRRSTSAFPVAASEVEELTLMLIGCGK